MKRRRNGEGTIYRYRNGWTAAVFVPGDNGTRRRQFVYGSTQGEVAEKLKQLHKAMDQGELVGSMMTVAEYLRHWVNDIVPGRVRPRTEESYRKTVELHLIPILGKKKLRELTTHDVRKLIQIKQKQPNAWGRPHSARSVHYMHAVLRQALGRAIKEEILVRNVAALVDPPRVRTQEVLPFTHEQALALIESSKSDRLHAMYVLALSLGLRKGELLGLSWDDVDFKQDTLRVRYSLQRLPDQGLVLTDPKTARSRRTIPLPQFCVYALMEHKEKQAEEAKNATHWRNDLNLVFTTPIGTPVEPRNLTRYFHAICDNAGVPRLRFHDMRHTCASLLLAQGVDARVIMDTLGHSMIGTTLNLYTHVMPVTQRAAAEKMDEALGRSFQRDDQERGL